MPVVGLSFNKFAVDKKAAVKGKIEVSNNFVIKDVEKSPLAVGSSKQDALRFHFEFTAKYEPKIGEIMMGGILTFLEKSDKITEIAESWKKKKEIPKEIMSTVMNTIFSRCNVEAIILAREVNLPPPVSLPSVKVK